MSRTYSSEKFHTKARAAAVKEITRRHPVLYSMFRAIHKAEGHVETKVRRLSVADVVELFQTEYDTIRYDALEKLKADAGWTDQRHTWRNR